MPTNELITSRIADIARKNRLFPETPEELKGLRITVASISYDILSDILKNYFMPRKLFIIAFTSAGLSAKAK